MKSFQKIIFFIGLVLLGINIYGLFKSLREPGIYNEQNTKKVNDITIKYPEVKEQLQRKDGETAKDFAQRITYVVADGMLYYWKGVGYKTNNDDLSKYNLRVPVWENYLLWLPYALKGKDYAGYEFSNYKKNLERGVGLCSTNSIVLKGVLNKYGIKAELWDIDGHHVVTRALVDKEKNEWWMLDASYGIVVPFDIPAIEANPEIIRDAYKDVASKYKPNAPNAYSTDRIIGYYGSKNNHAYSMDGFKEDLMYWAKWIIPFLLMLPYGLRLLKRK